jgi:hypothetical protein
LLYQSSAQQFGRLADGVVVLPLEELGPMPGVELFVLLVAMPVGEMPDPGALGASVPAPDAVSFSFTCPFESLQCVAADTLVLADED